MSSEDAAGVYPCCPHCDDALSDHVEHGGTVEKDRHDLPCSICEHQQYVQPLIDSATTATRQAAADAVLAEARSIASAHHVASAEHGRIVALGERLARAARGAK